MFGHIDACGIVVQRDSSVEIPWISLSVKGNPAFMSAREVSIAVDMVIDMQVRWGRRRNE